VLSYPQNHRGHRGRRRSLRTAVIITATDTTEKVVTTAGNADRNRRYHEHMHAVLDPRAALLRKLSFFLLSQGNV